MKKNKFDYLMFLIIVGVIAMIIIARFSLLNDLENNSTYYEFVTSIIIAGATAAYVLLTYKIVNTNTKLLEESKKEREVLEKQLELLKRTLVIPDIITTGSGTIDMNSGTVNNYICGFGNIKLVNVSNLPAINLKIYCFIRQVYNKKNEYFTSSVINYLKPGEEKTVIQRAKYKLKDGDIELLPDKYPLLKDEVKKALKEYKEHYAGTIILEYYDIYGEKNIVKSNIILSSLSEYVCTDPILIKGD